MNVVGFPAKWGTSPRLKVELEWAKYDWGTLLHFVIYQRYWFRRTGWSSDFNWVRRDDSVVCRIAGAR